MNSARRPDNNVTFDAQKGTIHENISYGRLNGNQDKTKEEKSQGETYQDNQIYNHQSLRAHNNRTNLNLSVKSHNNEEGKKNVTKAKENEDPFDGGLNLIPIQMEKSESEKYDVDLNGGAGSWEEEEEGNRQVLKNKQLIASSLVCIAMIN